NLITTNRVASAKALASNSTTWYNDAVSFFGRSGAAAIPVPEHPWPLEYQIKYHGTLRWRVVKFWEIITEFQLEDMGKQVLGSQASARTGDTSLIFNSAPHLI